MKPGLSRLKAHTLNHYAILRERLGGPAHSQWAGFCPVFCFVTLVINRGTGGPF